ncbi:hypothetical protein [Pinibacter aurantiacus]|uniref:Uncharacterized protein n=1 Tax=Pinibacter aurantiacus TaxID=2851599 RepID=A0A9E2W2J0_9BACT|nr:hypothetical protein [Pinibacter aurantiacus]MBV4355849.1 hypothetical protein [Pinibacter aurantiacus]
MNFLFLYPEKIDRENDADKDEQFLTNISLHNINDGVEFIDDAIRMHDQPFLPLMRTEESIAPGSPKELF